MSVWPQYSTWLIWYYMYRVGGWSSIHVLVTDLYNYRRFYVQRMIHTGVVGLSVHLIHVCLIPLVFCNEAINTDESSTLALWCNTGTCHNIKWPNLIPGRVGHLTRTSNKQKLMFKIYTHILFIMHALKNL